VKFGFNVYGHENKIEGVWATEGFKFNEETNMLESVAPIDEIFEDNITLTYKSEAQGMPFSYKGINIFRNMYDNKAKIDGMFSWSGVSPYQAIVLDSCFEGNPDQMLLLTTEAQYGGIKSTRTFQAMKLNLPVPYTARCAIFRVIQSNKENNNCEHFPNDILGIEQPKACTCSVVLSREYKKTNFEKLFQFKEMLEIMFETVKTYGHQMALLTHLIVLTPFLKHEESAFNIWINQMKRCPATMQEIPTDVVYNVVTLVPLMIESSNYYVQLNEMFAKYCYYFNLEAPGLNYGFSQLFAACCNQPASLMSTAIKIHGNDKVKYFWANILDEIRLAFKNQQANKGQKRIVVATDDEGNKNLKLASLPTCIDEKAGEKVKEQMEKTIQDVLRERKPRAAKKKSTTVTAAATAAVEKKPKRTYRKRGTLQVKTSPPPKQKKMNQATYNKLVQLLMGAGVPEDKWAETIQTMFENQDSDIQIPSTSSKYQIPKSPPSGKLASHLKQVEEEENGGGEENSEEEREEEKGDKAEETDN
jgi:hypothetical protein